MSRRVGKPTSSSRLCAPDPFVRRAPPTGVQVSFVAAHVEPATGDPRRGSFQVDGGVIERVLAIRDAQKAGGLFERFCARPLTAISAPRVAKGPFALR